MAMLDGDLLESFTGVRERVERARTRNFCEVQIVQKERGLSLLGRGWQTPDPSPRVSSGLPKCVAKDFLVTYGISETASTRTPSPSISSDCGAFQATDRYRTPSPNRDYYSAPHSPLVLPSLCLAHSPNQDDLGIACVVESNALCSPCPVPSEPMEPGISWASMFDEAMIGIDNTVLGEETAWPSTGSIGHPLTCAEACKYIRKAKGCKDGHRCDRCHLCVWKNSNTGKQQGSYNHRQQRHNKRLSR